MCVHVVQSHVSVLLWPGNMRLTLVQYATCLMQQSERLTNKATRVKDILGVQGKNIKAAMYMVW